MAFIDHDLHIHTELSSCSRDPEQNAAFLLEYAKTNGLTTICVTDHFWDETVPGASNWYKPQNFEHISKILPLPEAEGIRFLFGCETDMDKYCTIGVSKERMKALDFIIVPTTHLHMTGFTHRGDEDVAERAELWVKRFEALLDSDMPFEKTGIAHLTCGLMYRAHHLEVLSAISDEDMIRLFRRSADCGLGIELNFPALKLTDESRDIMLRPYRIAKEEGCRFYLGSDAHHPAEIAKAPENFAKIVELLELDDSHKFVI